ncbi:MAG: hypothetical protein AABM30_02695 [Actinomycetota bacterium]
MGTEATFYTIADAGFFPGLVALLNSLRLTGNSGELVVLDRGLTASQRALVEGHVRLAELPEALAGRPMLLKAYPYLLKATGTVVVIDSDMIVTRSLAEIAALAGEGRICAFPDPLPHRGRWFAEWEGELDLRAPLRRRTYLNAGFLALSVDHWPDLLSRWWELCERIPRDEHFARFEQPFWAGDQDVLNAILASEIPDEVVTELPADEEAYPDDLLETVVVDEASLRCELRGRPTSILHYSLGPKAWSRRAWTRLRDDAYVRLLPRLLFGDDVAVRLEPESVPLWLRPGTSGRAFVRGADLAHGGIRGAVHALPGPVRDRALALRNAVFRRL